MVARRSIGLAAALFALCSSAQASDIPVQITDQNGEPAANAVVVLSNDTSANANLLSGQIEASKLVDQKNETFVPHVTVIPRGGDIRFANTDAPLHQVYSFSPVKQFELTLEPGETSPAIVFDKAGIAAIGCNIHDHMIAYIFVTDSPWTVVTDENGRAVFSNVPAGTYDAKIWHPRTPPATEIPTQQLIVDDAGASLTASIQILPDHSSRRSHGGRY
jgi:plastocyanin